MLLALDGRHRFPGAGAPWDAARERAREKRELTFLGSPTLDFPNVSCRQWYQEKRALSFSLSLSPIEGMKLDEPRASRACRANDSAARIVVRFARLKSIPVGTRRRIKEASERKLFILRRFRANFPLHSNFSFERRKRERTIHSIVNSSQTDRD